MPMPRHPLEPYVFRCIANDERAGPDVILKQLREAAERDLALRGITDDAQIMEALDGLPGRTTISRMKRRYRELSERERAEYRYVRWPETFEAALLPWESSRLLLDLALLFTRANMRSEPPPSLPTLLTWALPPPPPERPTVRLGKWLWRLHLAAGDGAPLQPMAAYAAALAAREELGAPADALFRAVESWAMWQPWRPDRGADYEAAIAGGFAQGFDGVNITPDTGWRDQVVLEELIMIMGGLTDEEGAGNE